MERKGAMAKKTLVRLAVYRLLGITKTDKRVGGYFRRLQKTNAQR